MLISVTDIRPKKSLIHTCFPCLQSSCHSRDFNPFFQSHQFAIVRVSIIFSTPSSDFQLHPLEQHALLRITIIIELESSEGPESASDKSGNQHHTHQQFYTIPSTCVTPYPYGLLIGHCSDRQTQQNHHGRKIRYGRGDDRERRYDREDRPDRGARDDKEERFGRGDRLDREEPLDRDELPTEDEPDMERFRQRVGEQLLEMAALMRVVVDGLNQARDWIEALEDNVERICTAVTAIVAGRRAGMERDAQDRGQLC